YSAADFSGNPAGADRRRIWYCRLRDQHISLTQAENGYTGRRGIVTLNPNVPGDGIYRRARCRERQSTVIRKRIPHRCKRGKSGEVRSHFPQYRPPIRRRPDCAVQRRVRFAEVDRRTRKRDQWSFAPVQTQKASSCATYLLAKKRPVLGPGNPDCCSLIFRVDNRGRGELTGIARRVFVRSGIPLRGVPFGYRLRGIKSTD